jgi:hypothetical protein
MTGRKRRVLLESVESAFGDDIDHAVLQKIYGTTPESERRHSRRLTARAG